MVPREGTLQLLVQLLLLLSCLMVSTRANQYNFDGAYADAVSAEVECFMEKAWPPVESMASAFKSDFPFSPGADSPWQVDENTTAKLLYSIFRVTPDVFTAMYAGFENGKFIAYGRWMGAAPESIRTIPVLHERREFNLQLQAVQHIIEVSSRLHQLDRSHDRCHQRKAVKREGVRSSRPWLVQRSKS